MGIGRLAQEYGQALTLWGGVPVETLVRGTPEETRAFVRQAVECARRSPRFILGSSHTLCDGARYDNVMALFDEYARLAGR